MPYKLIACFLVIVTAAPFVGCGSGRPPGISGLEDDHPQYGEPAPSLTVYRDDPPPPPSPPPTLSILAPADNQDRKPGERIYCRVRMVVPDGGRLPSDGLDVELRDPRTGAILNSSTPKLIEKPADRQYIFEGWIDNVPKKPGKYNIVAVALDTLRVMDRPDASGKLDIMSVEAKAIRTSSKPVEVRVVP